MCPAAKTTRPCSLPFFLPVLPSISVRGQPTSLSFTFRRGNPFPQTKGPRGPSTSISFRHLDFVYPRSCPPSQVCNKDVTRASRDTGHGTDDYDRFHGGTGPRLLLDDRPTTDRSTLLGTTARIAGWKLAPRGCFFLRSSHWDR